VAVSFITIMIDSSFQPARNPMFWEAASRASQDRCARLVSSR
jgi:hypothetical protein